MAVMEQVKHMFEQKLYSNVTCLTSLLLTASDNIPELLPPPSKLQLLIWQADSYYEQKEWRKAENTYQKALQLKKSLLKNKSKSQAFHSELLSDIDIKYSIYLCHVSLKQFPQAITILEGIPGKQRTTKINMALAKLYQQSGMERSATTCYKEVLKECPLALDAALGLLSFGVKGVEVAALTLSGLAGTSNMEWLSTWIKAHASLNSREYPQAVTAFEQLNMKPLAHNVDILAALGEAHYLAGDLIRSKAILCQAHSTDPLSMKGMDIYATLLSKEVDNKELEKLSGQLLSVSEQHAEPWIAMGLFVHSTKIFSKAVTYAHKACLINPRNVEAFLLKGKVLLDCKKFHEALSPFRDALRISPHNFEAHQGLVKCYIAIHRSREALTMAGNACKQLGQTSKTLSLYASVWAVEPGSADKAEAYLEKALKLDPDNIEVIRQLGDLYLQERRYEKGIELLTHHLESQSNSRLHHMLADFYTHLNNNDKAMEHFSAAINLDNRNRNAIEGLQKLEQNSDGRGATNNWELELPDSDNEAEQDDSEVDGVWSDGDFGL